MIGGIWGDCDPANPRNRRTRASILVEQGGTTLLVDTGPELRLQLASVGVSKLDGVLYTHAHADHCHGIDDLRGINNINGQPIDVYGDSDTLRQLRERFAYCFQPPVKPGHYAARPSLIPYTITEPFTVGAIDVVPFVQDHGFSESLGFRFGPIAYSTDVVRLSEEAFRTLEGVDTWIVDCVRLEPAHPVHAHWEITRGWIERVKPRRAVLTHMNHTMDYDTLARLLPPGVEPGYDGMVLEV
jgi:phosphoribosyl 1,2-cyclic phosphate phosphodiesterase